MLQYSTLINYQEKDLFGKQPRKMRVIVPKVDFNKVSIWKPRTKAEGMYENYKAKSKMSEMQEMISMDPKWDDKFKCFRLNFKGRVKMRSVKNYKLCRTYDDSVCISQFGKVEKDVFNIDVRYPFSIMQAFGVAISSLDMKLLCR